MQDTSLVNYFENQNTFSKRQKLVYLIFKNFDNEDGLTDQEIKQILGVPDPNFVRPRRNELVRMGLVIPWKKRKCKITKKEVIAWRLKTQSQFQ